MITALEEKTGGRTRLELDSISFKEFIQSNLLMDLPTSNGIHTWTNKRKGTQHIASRLDHFLMSDNAIHLGRNFHTSIMPLTGSDQWPILMQWSQLGSRCNKPFQFESFWFNHQDFKEVVINAWNSYTPLVGSKMYQFQRKLKHLKNTLKTWNRTQFGNIFAQQKELEQQMSTLQQRIISKGRTDKYDSQQKVLLSKIEEHRQQEETLWRQKSRVRW